MEHGGSIVDRPAEPDVTEAQETVLDLMTTEAGRAAAVLAARWAVAC